MKKAFLILLLFTFQVYCQTGEPAVFTNNKQKITITTSENKCVLKNGQVNRITIVTENIDTRILNFSAPGLLFVRPENPEQTITYWDINLTNWEKGRPYKIYFNYRGRKTSFSDSLEIPVQDK